MYLHIECAHTTFKIHSFLLVTMSDPGSHTFDLSHECPGMLNSERRRGSVICFVFLLGSRNYSNSR